jgi:hypothetical protein
VTEIHRPDADLEPAARAIAGPAAVELAVIWATVDLDRTLAGSHIASTALQVLDDTLLGARVIVVPAEPDRPPLAIAEPITEGRLAATLARHGEGPAGRYVAVPDGIRMARARAAEAGIAVSRAEDGPFGASMLVLTGPVSGPHLILCDPRTVPSSP